MANKIGGYAMLLATLCGCGVTVEEADELGDMRSLQGAEPRTTAGEDGTASPRAEAQVGAVERTLLGESRRLTHVRRQAFHGALAERLGLNAEQRDRFLSLLAEAEDERLRETDDADASSRRAARLKSLEALLGPARLERYAELRKSRNEWYRTASHGRVAAASPMLGAERRRAP